MSPKCSALMAGLQRALAFEDAGGFYGVLRPRLGLESSLGNRFASVLADSVGAVFNALQRGIDLAKLLAFGLGQAEHQVLIVGIGADVRHVNRHVREVATARAKSLGLHRVQVANEFTTFLQKEIAVVIELPFIKLGLDGLDGRLLS